MKKQVPIMLESQSKKHVSEIRKKQTHALLVAKAQETYQERMLFTQLKYQIKNEEIMKK